MISALSAGTTGKITGTITDVVTKEPLIGCNVIIPSMGLGTASDLDGNFVILNIPPGKIDVVFSMIGYGESRIEDLSISIDQTTPLSVQLTVEAIEGSTIIVQNEKRIKNDRTNTEARVTAEELDVMPVMDVHDIHLLR